MGMPLGTGRHQLAAQRYTGASAASPRAATRQLETKSSERSERSRTAAAVWPKESPSPGRGLTPMTRRLYDPLCRRRRIASSGAMAPPHRGAHRDAAAVAELDDLAQDRLLVGADRPAGSGPAGATSGAAARHRAPSPSR